MLRPNDPKGPDGNADPMTISPRRRNPRLETHDYASTGAYFVTICTHGRTHLLGEIVDGVLRETPLAHVVRARWAEIPAHFPAVAPDALAVMPNHVHGLLWIAASASACGPSLGEVVRGFKAAVTRSSREEGQELSGLIWQRGYHDHVVRSEPDLERVREYVENNPLRWHLDRENAARSGEDDVERDLFRV